MYNIFRILGDFVHLITIWGLLGYLWKQETSIGISGKSQILFCIVFTARYLDLFVRFLNTYNFILKVMYLAITYVTVLSIYFKFKNPNRVEHDTFRFEFLTIAALLLSVVVNYRFDFLEVMWTFSEFLEAVAIIPQIHFVSKAGHSEKVVNYYIYGLLQYRVFYVVNWAYRYYEEDYVDLLSTVPGVTQCLIYFFYFFTILRSKNMDMYRACDVTDPSKQPVYIVCASDLPLKLDMEKRTPIEKV